MIRFFSLILIYSSLAWSNSNKIDPKLLSEMSDGKSQADVLLLLQDQGSFKLQLQAAETIIDRVQRIEFVRDSLLKAAQQTQPTVLRKIEDLGLQAKPYYVVNALLVKNVNQTQLLQLSQIDQVYRIAGDRPITMQLDVPVDRQKLGRDELDKIYPKKGEVQENLSSIQVDKVWQDLGVRGQGIVIGGQDSGFMWKHPALKKQYRGNTSFIISHDYHWHDSISKSLSPHLDSNTCGYSLAEPCDDSGHGTHTMGTMVGFDWNQQSNAVGIAPEAQWIGCRNMDRGVGKASTYLECFEYFLAPYPHGGNPQTDGDPRFAPHIINNSWACTASENCKGDEFLKAIDVMTAAGIAVVASAGNEGPSCGSMGDAPGFYSGHLFSVAAIDHRDGSIADFSSRGPSKFNGGLGPNISAPGQAIRSSVPSGGVGDGLYDYKSGTSMAGPHVAGVIALLWSAKPSLIGNIKATTEIIEKSATPKTSSQTCGSFDGKKIPNAVFGYGVINAWNAIQMAGP